MKRPLFLFCCLFILAIGINDVAAQSIIKISRDISGVVNTILETTVLVIDAEGRPSSGETVRFYTGQAHTQVSVTRDSGYTSTVNVSTNASGQATAYMKVISVPPAGDNVIIAEWNELSRSFTIYTRGSARFNQPPVFSDGASTERSISENSPAGTNIGSAVSATDANGDTLRYSLTGTDAASFSLNIANGQLKTKAALDYDTKNSYSVTVSAYDNASRAGSDSISVTIEVNAVPSFTDGDSTTRSIAENTAAGTNIGSAVAATDADGDTLSYTLGGTDAAAFSIVSTSGQLQTKDALDHETDDSYSVTVSVSDDNGGSDSIDVTISVTDVNEVPTFIEGSSTTRSVAENMASGINIGTAVAATDPDGDVLTYTLGGTDAASFSIVSTSGQIQTKAALDYETKNAYSLTVAVADGKGGTDSINVTINVTDVPETPTNNAPVFTEGSSTTRSIAENTASGRNIGTPIAATDADNDSLTYTLGGADAASFSIVSTSGQLRTSAALDYETKNTYSLTVAVSDGNGGTDSINVTINVTDVNEPSANNPPIFTEGDTATRTIAENTAAGENIGTPIAATDADNDSLTYTLGGADAASFSIVSTSGQLRTSAALDYETKNAYSLTVFVSDGNGGTDSITVTINVTDVNEPSANNPPIFTEGNTATRTIAENTAAGENIGTPVSATDHDGDTLTYSLSGADAASFSIVSTSGQLRTSAALDYETKNTYSITVFVSDGNGGSDSITVTINVTDVNEPSANNPPIFMEGNTATRTIAENAAAGENIGTAVVATDPDGDVLTYTLGGTDAAAFNCVSPTGQLKTRAALDYETKSSYAVVVFASDSKGGTDSITVTINVTDVPETPPNNAPVFTEGSSTTRSIAENTAAGENIGTPVAATDPDGDVLTYTLGGTDAASFSIVSTSGQLRTRAALDYETKNAYSLTVAVSDGKDGTDSINLTINVTNVNEAPSFNEGDHTMRNILEGTASGKNIGTPVAATDPDTGDVLTYTLGGTDEDSFSIVSTSGQIQTRAALDYETKDTYSLTVAVADGNGGTDSINLTINVTNVNEPPSFNEGDSTTRNILEGTASGRNIGTPVTATDPDYYWDVLTYTLGGTDEDSFSIVSTSGQIQTRAALDYETKNAYSVTVAVSDGNGGTDSINVTINVTDVNEPFANNPPIFTEGDTTTRSIAENMASGRNIGTAVAATDPDGDVLTYTLGGADAASFSIVSTSGQLQTRAALDYETKNAYSLTVAVSDGNGGTDSITVTINVTDVPETPTNNPPVFTEGSSTTRSIAENTASGRNIGSVVAATDPDGDALIYTLSGTDASAFSIVSTSGQIQTRAALDYETKDTYSLTVAVSDGKGGSDSINVTINVTNVNEPPSFNEGDNTMRNILGGTASGRNIGSAVAATDPDGDALIYTLSGTDAASFSIVSTSGQLQTRAALDYENTWSYSVVVSASDGKGGTDSITVTINVTDTNNAPVFTEGSSTTRSIAENTAAGRNIGTPVTATDPDYSDTLIYTLGGTDAASFSIVSTSGQLRTSAALDYETKSSYTVVVTTSDGNGGSANITVTINVTDIDEPVTDIDEPVTDPPPPANLVIEAFESNPSALRVGESFTLTTTVKNHGDRPSKPATLKYYRSANDRVTTSDTSVGSDTVAALSEGETTRVSLSLTAPKAAGTYYYSVCIGEGEVTADCPVLRITVAEIPIDAYERPPMYWIDAGALMSLTGERVNRLIPGVKNAKSVAVDRANGKIYWVEQTGPRTGRIQRADLNGGNVERVKTLTSAPNGIALDTSNQKLYITNAWGKVQRMNLDGSDFQSNLIVNLDAPQDVAVDAARGKIYWTESNLIRRADFNGENVQLLKTLTSAPKGLALDTSNQKLYITNAWDKVQRMNLDGTDFEPDFIVNLDAPTAVAVDAAWRKVYWTESNLIRRAALNGENVETVATELGTPSGLVLSPIPAEVRISEAQRPPIYWHTGAGALQRLAAAEVEGIAPAAQNTTGIAVDARAGKVYWTEQTGNRTGRIRRANLNGRNVQLVKELTSVPRGLAIDTSNGKLYLTNSWGKVQRLNLDGTGFQPNLIVNLDTPEAIAVDVAGGKVYWTEQTGPRTGLIRRANFNGTNIEMVRNLTSAPKGLAIDTANRKLYLTNAWGKVQRMNLDGTGFQPDLIVNLNAPQGIAVDVAARKIYWAERKRHPPCEPQRQLYRRCRHRFRGTRRYRFGRCTCSYKGGCRTCSGCSNP